VKPAPARREAEKPAFNGQLMQQKSPYHRKGGKDFFSLAKSAQALSRKRNEMNIYSCDLPEDRL
jgi:hypothetical protein